MNAESSPLTGRQVEDPQRGWTEQKAAARSTKYSRQRTEKDSHKGIFAVDPEAKMETTTTSKANYVAPEGPGGRLRGTRRELLEKQIVQMIREEMQAEMNTPTPETQFCSTTHRDFCIPGYEPSRPKAAQIHDYKTEQAITFWSENYQQVQGVTPVQNQKAPFRRSALFSTPLSEQLDEIEPPPED
uniref:Sperm associated antigen 8 n=1 Tax=Oryzias latipes TaxID=8090 RepID=A0A3P9IEZ6_ORYLA